MTLEGISLSLWHLSVVWVSLSSPPSCHLVLVELSTSDTEMPDIQHFNSLKRKLQDTLVWGERVSK